MIAFSDSNFVFGFWLLIGFKQEIDLISIF